MSNTNHPSENLPTTGNLPVPGNLPTPEFGDGDVPATIGGRSVTAFSAAGVSVQIASSKDELEAELLKEKLAAIRGGTRFFSVHNPGRSQYPPRHPPEGRI